VTAKNGKVVGTASVRDGDEIMLITKDGMVTRTKVENIRIVGRNTQGVRVMSPNEGDRIMALAKVAQENIGEAPPPKE
jgi:DNA gyrase subunit A